MQTSKKLYEAVAREMADNLRNYRDSAECLMLWVNIVIGLGVIFAQDNPLFDTERFYAACREED